MIGRRNQRRGCKYENESWMRVSTNQNVGILNRQNKSCNNRDGSKPTRSSMRLGKFQLRERESTVFPVLRLYKITWTEP